MYSKIIGFIFISVMLIILGIDLITSALGVVTALPSETSMLICATSLLFGVTYGLLIYSSMSTLIEFKWLRAIFGVMFLFMISLSLIVIFGDKAVGGVLEISDILIIIKDIAVGNIPTFARALTVAIGVFFFLKRISGKPIESEALS